MNFLTEDVGMERVEYGHKTFLFAKGIAKLTSTSITVKSLPGENEKAFTHRLMQRFGNQEGTIEIVFKKGRPNYAIITLS